MCTHCGKKEFHVSRLLTGEEKVMVDEHMQIKDALTFVACKSCGNVMVQDIRGNQTQTPNDSPRSFILMAASTFTHKTPRSYALTSDSAKVQIDPSGFTEEDKRIANKVYDSAHEKEELENYSIPPYVFDNHAKKGFIARIIDRIKGIFR